MPRFRQSESASWQGALNIPPGFGRKRGGDGLPFWTRAIVVDVRTTRRRWETGSLVRNKEKDHHPRSPPAV